MTTRGLWWARVKGEGAVLSIFSRSLSVCVCLSLCVCLSGCMSVCLFIGVSVFVFFSFNSFRLFRFFLIIFILFLSLSYCFSIRSFIHLFFMHICDHLYIPMTWIHPIISYHFSEIHFSHFIMQRHKQLNITQFALHRTCNYIYAKSLPQVKIFTLIAFRSTLFFHSIAHLRQGVSPSSTSLTRPHTCTLALYAKTHRSLPHTSATTAPELPFWNLCRPL